MSGHLCLGKCVNNSVIPLKVNVNGFTKIDNGSATGSFLDNCTVELVPKIRGDCTYGFIPSNFREFTALSGTTGVSDGKFICSTTTNFFDYSAIQSFRTLGFKNGGTCVVRFGAEFNCSNANVQLGVGCISIGDELSFGYNQNNFGVFHRYGGSSHIMNLNISTGVSGPETISLDINSTSYSIPVSLPSIEENAYEIEDYLNSNSSFSGSTYAEQVDDNVIITFKSDGEKTGTNSISSTGSLVGSFSNINVGVTKTTDFISQENWSPGINYTLDPSKGNNYQIVYSNGYGNVDYYIQNPNTNIVEKVHTINMVNNSNSKLLENNNTRLGCYAVNFYGISDTNSNVMVADFFGGNELIESNTRNPRGYSNTKSIGTTLTNILTLKNRYNYNIKTNQVNIEPLKLTLSNDGTKTAIFELRGNPTVSGPTNFTTTGTNLVSLVDTTGTTVTTNGTLLGTFTVAKGQVSTVNLKQLDIIIPPTLRLVIAGKMVSGSAADLSASIIWYEDI